MLKHKLLHTACICLNVFFVFTLADDGGDKNTEYNGIAVDGLDLKEVDKKICDILKSPTPKDTSQEEELMTGLQQYYEYLDNINDRLDRGWRQEDNVKRMLEVVGRAGPQMIHVAVNGTMFKEAWEWDDDDVDTMTTTVLGIGHMWDQVAKRTSYLTSTTSP